MVVGGTAVIMLKLFCVFLHSSVAHYLRTPALYDCTKTHSLEKE
jgi:hypothetical protein